METILVYKFPEMNREEIEGMIESIDLSHTRVYKDAVVDGKLETVPLLLRLGLNAEQIAEELDLDVDAVRKAAENPPRKTNGRRRPSRRKANGAAHE